MILQSQEDSSEPVSITTDSFNCMSKISNKVELSVSICIIVFSVFTSEFLIHKYIFSAPNPPEAIQSAEKQLSVPDVKWSEQPKTLIIALQASCHFCNESAPFYKRLIESAKGKNVKLVAVLPADVGESRAHLDKLGLADLEVKEASLDSIKVDGTPTLILVDDKGEVTNSWVGKLPPNKEIEVISKLLS